MTTDYRGWEIEAASSPAGSDLLCDIHRADYQDDPTAAVSPLPSAEIAISATPPPPPVQN